MSINAQVVQPSQKKRQKTSKTRQNTRKVVGNGSSRSFWTNTIHQTCCGTLRNEV